MDIRPLTIPLVLAIIVGAAGASMRLWPISAVAADDFIVEVKAAQWKWDIAPSKLPAGKPVLFKLTSSDVSHGFTVYDQKGAVVVQSVVVPGQANEIRHVFEAPGVYPVRCMLFCGMGHDGMKAELTVALP